MLSGPSCERPRCACVRVADASGRRCCGCMPPRPPPTSPCRTSPRCADTPSVAARAEQRKTRGGARRTRRGGSQGRRKSFALTSSGEVRLAPSSLQTWTGDPEARAVAGVEILSAAPRSALQNGASAGRDEGGQQEESAEGSGGSEIGHLWALKECAESTKAQLDNLLSGVATDTEVELEEADAAGIAWLEPSFVSFSKDRALVTQHGHAAGTIDTPLVLIRIQVRCLSVLLPCQVRTQSQKSQPKPHCGPRPLGSHLADDGLLQVSRARGDRGCELGADISWLSIRPAEGEGPFRVCRGLAADITLESVRVVFPAGTKFTPFAVARRCVGEGAVVELTVSPGQATVDQSEG
eukprot:3188155-Rhodomonas_salina.2